MKDLTSSTLKIYPKTSPEIKPSRCFVQLFKLYHSVCPKERPKNAFYLTPLTHPKANLWFAKTPYGHNKLSSTVKHLCSKAGITGYKTNHSLRATAASRLYQAGVDEQLVMECTSHHSIEGVRSYKRTFDVQQQFFSDFLNSKPLEEIMNITSTTLTTTPVHHLKSPSDSNPRITILNVTSCTNVIINIK